MIRVLFVDDDQRLRDSWARLLQAQSGIESAGQLECADGLLAEVEATRPDVVVLDLTMPGRDPIEACRQVTERVPSSRVIIYSGLHDQSALEAAFDAGAWGFLDKLSSPESIISSIRLVASGTPAFPKAQDVVVSNRNGKGPGVRC